MLLTEVDPLAIACSDDLPLNRTRECINGHETIQVGLRNDRNLCFLASIIKMMENVSLCS